MSEHKTALPFKVIARGSVAGSAWVEGGAERVLVLRLKGAEERSLYVGARTERGFVNLGRAREGEARYPLGAAGEIDVVIGDRFGPVACCSRGDIRSLYGYCDRLGEINEEKKMDEAPHPAPAPPQAGTPAEEETFDLREMGVTDVLVLEDSTLADDLEPDAEQENYYEREQRRESKMKEYFRAVESLMAGGERDAELETVFPSSRFVRIDFDGNGKYYVVGAVYENETIRYLCYGVPVQESRIPPKFVGVAQYIEAGGSGYLLLYQDADTGRMLTAEDFIG